MPETLGFIGLGNMGLPIALNLLRNRHGLLVYNRTAAKAAPVVAEGAKLCSRPEDVAEPGGIVFTMVADDRALEELCQGGSSFVAKLGHGGVHVSLSTIAPATARLLAQQHAKYGAAYVAAPVLGRPEAAAAARLWICVAGPPAAKQRIQPLLAVIGQGSFDFGDEPGAANVVKLCSNFLIAAALEALGEALALAQKNGLQRKDVAEMLTQTVFACPVYKIYAGQIAEHKYEPAGFRLPLGLKDINLVLQTAASSATPMPVASLLRDRWLSALAKGRENLDWSAIALAAAEDAGLR